MAVERRRDAHVLERRLEQRLDDALAVLGVVAPARRRPVRRLEPEGAERARAPLVLGREHAPVLVESAAEVLLLDDDLEAVARVRVDVEVDVPGERVDEPADQRRRLAGALDRVVERRADDAADLRGARLERLLVLGRLPRVGHRIARDVIGQRRRDAILEGAQVILGVEAQRVAVARAHRAQVEDLAERVGDARSPSPAAGRRPSSARSTVSLSAIVPSTTRASSRRRVVRLGLGRDRRRHAPSAAASGDRRRVRLRRARSSS